MSPRTGTRGGHPPPEGAKVGYAPDRVTDHALSLPAHHALSSDDVGYVIEVLNEIFDRL